MKKPCVNCGELTTGTRPYRDVTDTDRGDWVQEGDEPYCGCDDETPTLEDRMRELLNGYRASRIGHEECRDLTGYPDAMPSQRKDWRCDLCKQADELAQP